MTKFSSYLIIYFNDYFRHRDDADGPDLSGPSAKDEKERKAYNEKRTETLLAAKEVMSRVFDGYALLTVAEKTKASKVVIKIIEELNEGECRELKFVISLSSYDYIRITF